MTIRHWIGEHLRYLADRIDWEHAFVGVGAHFNMVRGEGMVITQTEGIPISPPAPGVPLWFRQSDYDRAFREDESEA